MPAVDSLEETGRSIAGRYVVEEGLGRGGMAAVYRVRDTRSGAALALKRGFAHDPTKVAKREALLQREYYTLAQLAHPRIIEVYDYGVDERGPYYTMELLDGADLEASQNVSWQDACSLLCDVASSLAILHSRGLLHRDISARNVRRTADGRAKLLDFGAMTSMGVAKEVVGTPPFVAPEALQMQALDARADLFSLGALAYYLLTGRHAYPVRRMSELRNAWRSKPVSPSRLAQGLPPALSALVMQLLSFDRTARPESAAEVMSRLCTIAGLSEEEHEAVPYAYLATPTLVGRDAALITLRKRLLSLSRGDGGTVLVDGVAGSGRSRLLDACAIEGRLVGAIVLRADASDAASGEWGVARAIGAQLLEHMPEEANRAARLSRDVLAHVLEGLRTSPPNTSVTTAQPDRSLLLRELRDFMLALSRQQRLVIVIDDVDRIDERSTALFAALGHKTARYPLIVALSIEHTTKDTLSPALRLLRSISELIELEQLSGEQTEALMRSVFGDVPNLALTAASIYGLSQGNPRTAMMLAQHLVDRGLARYQAGSWSLPAQLNEGDLPSSLSASLSLRLDEVGDDARELCELLCLADRDGLSLTDYPELTSHHDPRRVFAALDELVAARILVASGDRYRFSQRGFISVLQDAMPKSRAVAAHSRLAQLLARTGGELLRRVHHLLEGGSEREAVELLCTLDLRSRRQPLPLLEAALDAAQRHDFPVQVIRRLRLAVLAKASAVLAVDTFRRHVGLALEQLERDSGLTRYAELVDLAPAERLTEALGDAQRSYDATPEAERGHSVIEAIQELVALSQSFCAMAMTVHELDLLLTFPSITPLVPLSPALALVQLGLEAATEWLRGRVEHSKRNYEQILARFDEANDLGLDDETLTRGRLGTCYALAIFEATMGIPTAEKRAELLDHDRELRVSAWRVRHVFQLNQGNVDEARKCLRRAELLQLQDGIRGSYLGTSAGIELLAHVRMGDLVAVKSVVASLSLLAGRHPGWKPVLALGQSQYRKLQGDPQGALEILLPALALAPAGRHVFFACIAAAHIELLVLLGRYDEALAQAREYLAICDREGFGTTDPELYVAVAEAFARAGEHDPALRVIEQAMESSERLGRTGTALALLYQARARLAIWMNDRPTFEHFAERCAREYKRANNPALSTNLERLLDEAQQTQIGPLEALPEVRGLIAISQTNTEYATVHSRMGECVDANDRARCALTLLLEHLESFAGYLYGIDGNAISLLTAVPDLASDPALSTWVAAQVASELGADAQHTAEYDAALSDRFYDQEGRCFECIVLYTTLDKEQKAAAALVAQVMSGTRRTPDRALLARMAEELLSRGDVNGAVLPSVSTA